FLVGNELQAVVLIDKGTLVHCNGRFGRGCCTVYGGLVKLGAGGIIGIINRSFGCDRYLLRQVQVIVNNPADGFVIVEGKVSIDIINIIIGSQCIAAIMKITQLGCGIIGR